MPTSAPAPTPTPTPVPPLPEVVGLTARDGSPDFDYTIYVDCTVRNAGGSGQVEVVAELRNGGYWKKRETLRLVSHKEEQVTLTFPEPEFLAAGLDGYQYNCTVSAN